LQANASDEPRRLPEVEVVESQKHGCRIWLRVPHDLGCLEGHFPDLAIVPGIALIGWAEHFAREHLGFAGEVRAVERVKFNQLVRPGRSLVLALSAHSDNETTAYRFQSTHDQRDLASGQLHFTANT